MNEPLINKQGEIIGIFEDKQFRSKDEIVLLFNEVQGQFAGYPYEVDAWKVEYVIDFTQAQLINESSANGAIVARFGNVNSFYRLK